MADPDEIPTLHTIGELRAVVASTRGAYIRYSKGPAADRGQQSMDYESGLELPGLSVNPLDPEPWWTRPIEDWLARQICNYAHLREASDGERRGWVLEGREVGRGPDNEPLVEVIRPVAWLGDELIDEARRIYAERFDVGRDSTGSA